MQDPKAIVLHRTAGPTLKGAIEAFKKGGAGTHFVIDKDGTIYQTASLEKSTYHVGKIKARCKEEGTCTSDELKTIEALGWAPKKLHAQERTKSYPDRYPTNIESIGIEVVGAYNKKTKKWEKATKEQLESVKLLVKALQKTYQLKDEDVFRHEDISYKKPGEGAGLGYDKK